MTARLGFSLSTLQMFDASACSDDVRLVWRDGDELNIGIVQPRENREKWDCYFIQKLNFHSPRELRLLGLQMIRHADNIERTWDKIDVVIG